MPNLCDCNNSTIISLHIFAVWVLILNHFIEKQLILFLGRRDGKKRSRDYVPQESFRISIARVMKQVTHSELTFFTSSHIGLGRVDK